MAAIATAEPIICFQVLDAKTGEVLTATLDATDLPKADKYRGAFDEAVGNFPDREIVVVRVPLSAWGKF